MNNLTSLNIAIFVKYVRVRISYCMKCFKTKNITKSMTKKNKLLLLSALCLTLNGCSAMQKLSQKHNPQNTVSNTKIADKWQASLPHGGSQANLAQFWQQFDDALLLELIAAAQTESATLASAKARIAQARAKRVQTDAALLPAVDGSASASRSVQQPATSVQGNGVQGGGSSAYNNAKVDVQASWELDIFGVNHATRDANLAQENAAQANWHDARVAVAAELANAYFSQRFCEKQLNILEADAKSRAESLRLTEITVAAGFSAPASAHLARASMADAAQQIKAQLAQCDLDVKALVALTGLDESALREKLKSQSFNPNNNALNSLFSMSEVPAQIITQRPDINAAEADLISAATDIRSTYAESLPKVSLNGSIGWMRLSGSNFSSNGKTWSLGPISITFPIFHPGVAEAGLASAEANYEDKAATYRSKVRYAVKEVEDALVNLHSANTRQADISEAVKNYQASFSATETKVKAGFANLIELEEQRRSLLLTETTALNNLKQRTLAWVSLYRAAGGGWNKKVLAETGNSK